MTAPGTTPHPPSLLRAALGSRCPNCGEGRLFQGYLKVVPTCEACGADLSAHDSADGPAVFIILIAGFLVVGLALFLEVAFEPPMWLHLVIEVPLILIISFGLLRPLKALFVAIQFRHKAREYGYHDL